MSLFFVMINWTISGEWDKVSSSNQWVICGFLQYNITSLFLFFSAFFHSFVGLFLMRYTHTRYLIWKRYLLNAFEVIHNQVVLSIFQWNFPKLYYNYSICIRHRFFFILAFFFTLQSTIKFYFWCSFIRD